MKVMYTKNNYTLKERIAIWRHNIKTEARSIIILGLILLVLYAENSRFFQ
jgi:hypothetical protein